MSEIFSQRLANIDAEREHKRKEIINEHRNFLISKINDIKSQIIDVDEQIKPFEEKKNIYISQKKDYEKELQSICEHQLMEYNCWDGHRQSYDYTCTICNIHLYKNDGFKVIGRY